MKKKRSTSHAAHEENLRWDKHACAHCLGSGNGDGEAEGAICQYCRGTGQDDENREPAHD